jgi:hypothetical protein
MDGDFPPVAHRKHRRESSRHRDNQGHQIRRPAGYRENNGSNDDGGKREGERHFAIRALVDVVICPPAATNAQLQEPEGKRTGEERGEQSPAQSSRTSSRPLIEGHGDQ